MNNNALLIMRILSDGKTYSLDALSNLIELDEDYIYQIIKSELSDFELDFIDHGYHWKEPIVWLNKDSIYSQVQYTYGKLEIILFDVIDSTNTYLKNLLKKNY